ncbi:hypothetical protein L917_20665 [Phytophthora nicotianae]|uniref:RxLR effector protein n=1 Tax=Phytophthora nicotianae TaxID=4792 RepID=W2K1V0_PHYNI|nr:hypothetical protein L917_20665 [Phytophthora nicotianae]
MRLLYELLFALCVVITVCDAVSPSNDYALEATVQQSGRLRASHRSRAAAEARGMPDYRLLRTDSFVTENDAADVEQRGIPGLSKLSEWIEKGKSKMSDLQLRIQYKDVVRHGVSDDRVTKAWVQRGKPAEDIYNRWIRLKKSDLEASKLLLEQNLKPRDLYDLWAGRGMSMEDIYKLWRELKLDDTQIYNMWVTLPGKTKKTDDEIFAAWFNANKSIEDVRKLLRLDDGNNYSNANTKFWLKYIHYHDRRKGVIA